MIGVNGQLVAMPTRSPEDESGVPLHDAGVYA